MSLIGCYLRAKIQNRAVTNERHNTNPHKATSLPDFMPWGAGTSYAVWRTEAVDT